MAQEWIEGLTGSIKQNAREAAEAFGRQEHRSAIITEKGSGFFGAVAIALEDNITEIRRQLQGDVTSSEMTFTRVSSGEIKLTRRRFPWFDAHLTYKDPAIVLNYARGPGVAGDPVISQDAERQTRYFEFQVDDADVLSVQQSFDESPQIFRTPEDLARSITELLFKL